jgi:hypothetical protein
MFFYKGFELSQDFGLTKDSRVKPTDHFEQKGISLLTLMRGTLREAPKINPNATLAGFKFKKTRALRLAV